MSNKNIRANSNAFLRISLGLLFLIAGLTKLVDLSGVVGMIGNGLGFPTPFDEFFGWVVMLTEIIFGSAVLIGFNVKLTVIPLIIIIIVAAIGIHVPNINGDAMVIVIVLLHLITLAALIHIALTGPGSYSVEK